MSILNQEYSLGWYGDCDLSPCEPFDLLSDFIATQVKEIYEVGPTGTNYHRFLSDFYWFGFPENNDFNELSCGKTYLIILHPGSTIDIPGFVPTDADDASIKLLSETCNIDTVVSPSVTPTTTTTPSITITPSTTPSISADNDDDPGDNPPGPGDSPTVTPSPTPTNVDPNASPTVTPSPTSTPADPNASPTVTPSPTPTNVIPGVSLTPGVTLSIIPTTTPSVTPTNSINISNPVTASPTPTPSPTSIVKSQCRLYIRCSDRPCSVESYCGTSGSIRVRFNTSHGYYMEDDEVQITVVREVGSLLDEFELEYYGVGVQTAAGDVVSGVVRFPEN